jgi:DNA-3-methyladenine glycosylase II
MALQHLSGQLAAVQPFDFAKSLAFIGAFPPVRGEQTQGDLTLTKGVMVGGQPVVFRLTGSGSSLSYEAWSPSPIAQAALEDRLRFFLSLDDDLEPFYAVGRRDPAFAPIREALHGLHQVKFLTPFENVIWAVLTQRTPMPMARKMKAALVAAKGAMLTIDGVDYPVFPQADQLAGLSEVEIQEIIGHKPKAAYLANVIAAFARTDERWMREAPTLEVEAWLRGIKGIGPWSAMFVLIRGLGRMDAALDAGEELMHAVGAAYGEGRPATAREVAARAKPYGALQGYWSYYLRAFGAVTGQAPAMRSA